MILSRIGRALCLALGFVAASAVAQPFPSKPIRVVVPFAAGSSIDLALRVISEKLQQSTGQPLVVDNRGGAGGAIAAEAVAAAPADGYTLMAATIGQMSINPHAYAKLRYDPEKSFTPITQLVRSQYIFAVHPEVPARTLREFVDWAKTAEGKASFASTGPGTPAHFAGVMLNRAAGIGLVHVPYKGGAPAFNDLLGGQVSSMFTTIGLSGSAIGTGKVRVLAVTSERRLPALPDVPTFVELGYPDVVAYVWSGLVAPAGTPPAVVATLAAEFGRILRLPDVREKLLATDQEPVGSAPAEFAEFMRDDRRRWGAAIAASGFKAVD
jgi:tripartite-type tricarboxylate transporter receptor subunit TctC